MYTSMPSGWKISIASFAMEPIAKNSQDKTIDFGLIFRTFDPLGMFVPNRIGHDQPIAAPLSVASSGRVTAADGTPSAIAFRKAA